MTSDLEARLAEPVQRVSSLERKQSSAGRILLALGALLVIVTLAIVAPTVIFWH